MCEFALVPELECVGRIHMHIFQVLENKSMQNSNYLR